MADVYTYKVLGYTVLVDSADMLRGVRVHMGRGKRHDLAEFVFCENGDVELERNNADIPDADVEKIRLFLKTYRKDIINKWTNKFGKDHHFDR